MKLTLTFLAVLAVSGIATVHSVPVKSNNGLKEHIMDFVKLLPVDKMENLFYDYLSEDEDFAETLDFLQGEEFKSLLSKFESTAELKAYLDFLEESGLPAYDYVNKLNEFLGLDPITAFLREGTTRITGGLPGFVEDLKALLPIDEIKKLYNEKISTVPEFSQLIKHLQSQEAYNLFEKMMYNPTIVGLLEKVEAKGVDVNAILDFVGSIFNIKFPTRPVVFVSKSLVEHFKDFYEKIPREVVECLFYEYLAEDEDFAMTLDYLQSKEFKAQLTSIEYTPEFKEHLNFFENFGIPAYKYVNKVNQLLEIDPITSPHFLSNHISGGLPGFFKDVTDRLPLHTIRKIYNDKMESAPEFAEFINKLLSEDYYSLVDKLLTNKDIQELINKAESKGVDFEVILDFIGSIFGVHFPRPESYASKSLVQDLQDFLKLVPVQELENLFYDYLAEDEDFAAALDFVQSEEFKGKLVSVESTSEFKEYLNFLEKHGLPAYEYVNNFNSFMGIDLIKPLRRLMSSRITGGLPGFVKDAKALFPIDAIKNMHDDKLKSSKVFAEFVQSIQSEESYNLFAKLIANPTIQEMLASVESKGVDVEAILEFITSIFGFKFPPRP